MEIRQTRATLADAVEMAPLMRDADRAEVWAEGGYSPFDALENALRVSGSQAWTVRVNNKIMAMWGVVPISMITGYAVPWLLTSGEVDRHPRTFVRCARAALAKLRERYAILTNRVDARYERAIRWARRMGFVVTGPETLDGYTFYTITMRGV